MESMTLDNQSLLLVPDFSRQEQPEWLKAFRQEGWNTFEKLPMPGRKDEQWRFSNLKAFNLEEAMLGVAVTSEALEAIKEGSKRQLETGGALVFANGVEVEVQELSEELAAKGVVFTTLEKAIVEHEALFRQHFMVQGAHLGSDKFAALHQAHVGTGSFLYVPEGVECEVPFEVFYWLSGENAVVFPHTLIIAGKGSKVTLVDHFRSVDAEAKGFACGVNDLYVGEGAEVIYLCDQDWGTKVAAVQMNSSIVEKEGHVASLNLNLGGEYSRVESRSRMAGENSRSDMLAATLADSSQIFDLRTYQDHGARNTYSDLLYKNALTDRSRAVFSGLIRVEEGAHQTDAYQTNRSLILSDDAESDSMPGLEILADDVKCSHGSTASPVDEDELFYFLARGIDRASARQLVVLGFLGEVWNRIPNSTIAEKMTARVAAKFADIKRRGQG